MKRFEFPLARVAHWYEQALRSDEAALRSTLEGIGTLDRQVQAVQQRKAVEQTRMQSSQILTGVELQVLALYTKQAERESARLLATRARLEVLAAEQRTKLVASRRRARLMENLQSRKREEWQRDVDREENAIASELYLTKFTRESNE